MKTLTQTFNFMKKEQPTPGTIKSYKKELRHYDYWGRGAPAKGIFINKFYMPVETSINTFSKNMKDSHNLIEPSLIAHGDATFCNRVRKENLN